MTRPYPFESDQLNFSFVRPPNHVSTYSAHLIHADARSIVLEHAVMRDEPLIVGDTEVVATGYRSVWFLFKGDPFDIGRFYSPDGTFTGFYVDILEPVRWLDGDPKSLEPLIDLFLDLWITPHGQVSVLDQEDFDDAVRSGVLSLQQTETAQEALRRCVDAAAGGRFPPAEVRHFESQR